jgi:pilus assembly protein CpaF
LKVSVNTVDSKFALDKKKIEEFLGMEVFSEIPYDADTVIASINSGVPAVTAAPTSTFSNGIKQLSKQLLEHKHYESSMRTSVSSASAANAPQTAAELKTKRTNLKKKLHKHLISELNAKSISLKDFSGSPEKERDIRELTRKIIQGQIANEEIDYSREERAVIVDEMLDEVLGLGCIEALLKDPEITEIMVNGPDDIYVEKKGRLTLSDLSFTSTEQLMNVIDRIVSPLGRRIDESSPLVDARLADGSRVNAIIPPLSLVGPSITIRKFSKKKLAAEDLIKFGALTKEMAEFLRICVQLRKNIVVSGGTGSGKTTLLNVVSSFIPEDERILTVEDSAELKLPQKHVVRLESRPPSIEGTGEISIRRLVINALRMRPDRIVVGECRGGETLDMLQAMNTGHDGSLTTIHSNSPKDGISRIATMVMMAGMDLPEKAIREQIASAVHIIVQLSRISDGSRKVVEITEVTGIKDEVVGLVPIFKYEQTGIKDGKVVGKYVSTGNKPSFIHEIDTHGLTIDKNIFNKGELS